MVVMAGVDHTYETLTGRMKSFFYPRRLLGLVKGHTVDTYLTVSVWPTTV
jgi:hypothetical protein